MRIPPIDPFKPPSPAKRLAARMAKSDAGMRGAAWYLQNIVPRVEPLLVHWTRGRMTSLPIVQLLFLKTVGAKTGQDRVTPLSYFTDGDNVILVASNYGRPNNPAWYHNVKSNPDVRLEARGREGRYVVREATDGDRDRLWSMAARWTPPLTKYQAMAGNRAIPVMTCAPLD